MKQFTKILVYTDALADKHPALERAVQLAKHNDAELKIVDVLKNASGSLGRLYHRMRSVVEQERRDRLHAVCEPLRGEQVRYSTELLVGRPFAEIVREVVHDGFHLVLKTATPAATGEEAGVMSPVDMRLLRNCPCPVWIERPEREVRCERVLVAIDPQSPDDQLNKTILELGLSIVRTQGASIDVVGAWEVPDEEFLADKVSSDNLSRFVDDVQSVAQSNLNKLLKGHDERIPKDRVHFKKARAAQTIIDCAQSFQPDVLVLGTVARTDVKGLLMGNTAATVLRQVNCSVLAVKPKSLFRA